MGQYRSTTCTSDNTIQRRQHGLAQSRKDRKRTQSFAPHSTALRACFAPAFSAYATDALAPDQGHIQRVEDIVRWHRQLLRTETADDRPLTIETASYVCVSVWIVQRPASSVATWLACGWDPIVRVSKGAKGCGPPNHWTHASIRRYAAHFHANRVCNAHGWLFNASNHAQPSHPDPPHTPSRSCNLTSP